MRTNRRGCIHVYTCIYVHYIYIYIHTLVPRSTYIALNVYTNKQTNTQDVYIGESIRRKSSSGVATFDSRRCINVYDIMMIYNMCVCHVGRTEINKFINNSNRKKRFDHCLRCIRDDIFFFF